MASHFLVDWAWFSAIGYWDVFWIVLTTKVFLFVAVFMASASVLWTNGWLASRLAKQGTTALSTQFEWQAVAGPPSPDLSGRARPYLLVLIVGAAGVLGFLIAVAEMSNWDVVLRFLFQMPYGQNDPVFGKDIGFYLFSLPAYLALKNWILLAIIFSFLIAGAVYGLRGDIAVVNQRLSMSRTAIAHASALLALFFGVNAWSYYLDRFLLLYGDNGVVVGASYTDLPFGLPVLWFLIGLSIIAAVVC